MMSLKTSLEVALELAQRVRAKRLELGWSQEELARRAGLRLPTYRAFERNGRISLLRLLQVLNVLGNLMDIELVCVPAEVPKSLDELNQPVRKRGKKVIRA